MKLRIHIQLSHVPQGQYSNVELVSTDKTIEVPATGLINAFEEQLERLADDIKRDMRPVQHEARKSAELGADKEAN